MTVADLITALSKCEPDWQVEFVNDDAGIFEIHFVQPMEHPENGRYRVWLSEERP